MKKPEKRFNIYRPVKKSHCLIDNVTSKNIFHL